MLWWDAILRIGGSQRMMEHVARSDGGPKRSIGSIAQKQLDDRETAMVWEALVLVLFSSPDALYREDVRDGVADGLQRALV